MRGSGLDGDLLAEVEMTIEQTLPLSRGTRLLVPGTARQVCRAPLRRFPFGAITYGERCQPPGVNLGT